jgi:hypothetical protein
MLAVINMKKIIYIILFFPFLGLSQTSPGGVYADSLKLWLKADAGTNTLNNNVGITSWADQSTYGNNATGTGSVTYQNSFSNFNPGLLFTNDAQPISGSITRTNGTASTIFVVGEIPSISDKCLLEIGDGTGRAFLIDRRYAAQPSFSFQTNTKSVWSVSDPGGTLNALIYEDGFNFYSQAKVFNTNWTTGANFYLGDDRTGGNRLTGGIAEIIYYDLQLSATDQVKVESYLAIKYGITLDNTDGETNGDYIATNGSTVWDASLNTTFHNGVIGIARDDSSALYQRQSHQVDDSTRIYLSTLSTLNSSNGGTFSSDEQFLLVGHNSGALKSEGSIEYPSGLGILNRIEREWKITNTAFNGTFSLDITLETALLIASDLRILIDNDLDFSNASLYNPSITVAGNTVTISGLSITEIPSNSTRYLTLASLNSATPLPIELLNFKVTLVDNNFVKLDWQTASEVNNDHFSIEYSRNGTDWQELTRIDGAGNSSSLLSYELIDNSPYMGISYYQLKQTDFDGQFSYSQIRSVNIENLTNSAIKIYPNPAYDQVILIGNALELEQIKVFNTLGQDVSIFTKIIEKNEGKTIIDLSNLISGKYYIKTKNTSNIIYTK